MVRLQNNVCIDENYMNSRKIAAMPRIVSQKCGFDDNVSTEDCDEQKTQIENQRISFGTALSEMKNCESELNTKASEILRLNAALTAANNAKDRLEANVRDAKLQCNNQGSEINTKTNELTRLRAELVAANTAKAQSEANVRNVRMEMENCQLEMKAKREENQKLTSELVAVKTSKNQLEVNVGDLQKTVQFKIEESEKMSSEVRDKNQKIDSLEEQLRKIQAQQEPIWK